jgi:hypothetical protein
VTFLPILRRELAVAARRTATYRQRVLFGAIAVLTVAVMFMFSPQTRLTGSMVFQIISWGGFVVCLLEGLRATADSISLERREGTLGLLLLTDTRGRHVVAGKLVAACVQSLTAVLSILPAFSLPLLLGGVTAGECWRVMLALLAALLTAIAAGTLVSALVRTSLTAFAVAFFALAALLVAPILLAVVPGTGLGSFKWFAGALEMFLRVPDRLFIPQNFWLAAACAAVSSIAMILLAGLLLERWPQLEVVSEDTWLQRWLRPQVGRTENWGGASAQASPSVWLAERTLPGRRALWLIVGAGGLGCVIAGWTGSKASIPIVLAIQGIVAFVIKLWAAAVAPISLNNARRNGALELLLCTPMSPVDLVRGQVDALYGYFMGPALCAAVGFPIAGMMAMVLGRNEAGMGDPSFFVFGFFWLALFLLDLHALAYVGLWNGLTTARVDRAVAKTVFAVLILPWLTMVIPVIGCVGMIVWPIFWIYWASARLRKRFREEAATQFAADTGSSGWLPWSRASA